MTESIAPGGRHSSGSEMSTRDLRTATEVMKRVEVQIVLARVVDEVEVLERKLAEHIIRQRIAVAAIPIGRSIRARPPQSSKDSANTPAEPAETLFDTAEQYGIPTKRKCDECGRLARAVPLDESAAHRIIDAAQNPNIRSYFTGPRPRSLRERILGALAKELGLPVGWSAVDKSGPKARSNQATDPGWGSYEFVHEAYAQDALKVAIRAMFEVPGVVLTTQQLEESASSVQRLIHPRRRK